MFADNDTTRKLRWYRVPPQTPVFPEHHNFASRTWDCEKKIRDGVGEVWGSPRQKTNAKFDKNLPLEFCGEVTVFQGQAIQPGTEGQPDAICPRNVYGFLQCCFKTRFGLLIDAGMIKYPPRYLGGTLQIGGEAGTPEKHYVKSGLALKTGGGNNFGEGHLIRSSGELSTGGTIIDLPPGNTPLTIGGEAS
jgi:hypothetical protein